MQENLGIECAQFLGLLCYVPLQNLPLGNSEIYFPLGDSRIIARFYYYHRRDKRHYGVLRGR
jgi:hypothetical protein